MWWEPTNIDKMLAAEVSLSTTAHICAYIKFIEFITSGYSWVLIVFVIA
jgi:hypothetical protein